MGKKISVNIDRFIHTYNSSIPESLFVQLLNAQFRGILTYELEESVIARIETKEAKRLEQELRFNACVDRNNRGFELEKYGDVDGAISIYEENIADGYPATHSFDRLMVLYRKAKNYKNEIRVIKKAIIVFKSDAQLIEKYTKRLGKAELLLHKSKL